MTPADAPPVAAASEGAGEGLSFAAFRRHNLARCEAVYHPVDEWSETDWMTAVAGEVGEAANMVKKRRRGDGPLPSVVGKEIADAVTYLDLLAYRLGLADLGVLTADKFDEVSERIGWDGPRLAAPPAAQPPPDEPNPCSCGHASVVHPFGSCIATGCECRHFSPWKPAPPASDDGEGRRRLRFHIEKEAGIYQVSGPAGEVVWESVDQGAAVTMMRDLNRVAERCESRLEGDEAGRCASCGESVRWGASGDLEHWCAEGFSGFAPPAAAPLELSRKLDELRDEAQVMLRSEDRHVRAHGHGILDAVSDLRSRAAAPPEDRWHYDAEPPSGEWVAGWVVSAWNAAGWWTPILRDSNGGLSWRYDRAVPEEWKLVAWRRVSSPLPPPPAGLEGDDA